MAATAFLAPSSKSLAVWMGQPDSARMRFASSTLVPGRVRECCACKNIEELSRVCKSMKCQDWSMVSKGNAVMCKNMEDLSRVCKSRKCCQNRYLESNGNVVACKNMQELSRVCRSK